MEAQPSRGPKRRQPASKMGLAEDLFFFFLLDHPLRLNNGHYISLLHFLLAGPSPIEVEKKKTGLDLISSPMGDQQEIPRPEGSWESGKVENICQREAVANRLEAAPAAKKTAGKWPRSQPKTYLTFLLGRNSLL